MEEEKIDTTTKTTKPTKDKVKNTECSICRIDFGLMDVLWDHHKVHHFELVKKYQCPILEHAHINADTRRKCISRNKINIPIPVLEKFEEQNKPKIIMRTLGIQCKPRKKDRILNRMPQNDSDITFLMEAIADYYKGKNCLFNGFTHNGITSNFYFKAIGKPKPDTNPGRKVQNVQSQDSNSD